MLNLWPHPRPAVAEGQGLVLREWTRRDARAMTALFDTPEMDRRTPLASPFDLAAARRYVAAAHRTPERRGSLQLAITEDGHEPLGEILAFPDYDTGSVELAYAVGAAHTGRGLARRAVAAMLGIARAARAARAHLLIAPDNAASERVATAAGFARTGAPAVERRRKGYVLHLETWQRPLT